MGRPASLLPGGPGQGREIESKMPGLDTLAALTRDTEAKYSAVPQAIRAPALSRSAVAGAAKRMLDVAGALALLIALAPAFLLIALLVSRDGGPVFFAHPRVGRGGALFGCLKFRSMVIDSEARLRAHLAADAAARAEWEATRKLKNDPRVTRIGRFLRATSLDELPQVLNVLRGEMSLVGPRPVQQAELERFYGAAAAYYMAVRPGITGLWQVSGRSETSYAQRVALDVAYVATGTFWQDVRILLRTPVAVLSRKGAV